MTSTRSPQHEAAQSYAARGWAVLPLFPVIDGVCGCGTLTCSTPGKHPIGNLVPRGLHNASTTPAQIAHWWEACPDAHIGIRTGTASQLIVVDLDERALDGREGSITWRRLLATHAQGVSPETVEAITGGGGRHLFFAHPEGIVLAGLKDTLGPGLEIKAENGYVVAAPSGHVSGRDYVWDVNAHPDDMPLAPLPSWLLGLVRTRAPRESTTVPRLPVTLDPLELAELTSALSSLSSDDRDQWVQIGMMLHATGDESAGFQLWDAWSQTSEKYNAADQRRVWRSFRDRNDGLTIASLYQRAHTVGWQRPSLTDLARVAGVTLPGLALVNAPVVVPKPVLPAVSDPLEAPLPGILESIVQWSLSTAASPVRLYSVAAAIGLGSVVCARRYATDANNFSSLYLLVVGKSGTGKEHVRTTVETVLRAANASALLGPNGWTSAGAVFSGLQHAPQQLAVIDEIGQMLAAASGTSEMSNMKDGAFTQLMELYGRLHAHAHPSQYSTQTLSKKQRDEQERRSVERPGLSMVGLTTPETWYSALKTTRIKSGFVNRLLVIESDQARADFRFCGSDPVPDAVSHWAMELLAPRSDLDLLNRPTELGAPTRLTIDPASADAFQGFRRECNALADRLEDESLGELPMRAAEQAMRLSLISTLADRPEARTVTVHHAHWGIAVARVLLMRLIPKVRERMTLNPVHALRLQFLAAVREAGPRGLTSYELARSRVFNGSTKRDREDTVLWALEGQRVTWSTLLHGSNGGRPRRALVLTELAEPELELSA